MVNYNLETETCNVMVQNAKITMKEMIINVSISLLLRTKTTTKFVYFRWCKLSNLLAFTWMFGGAMIAQLIPRCVIRKIRYLPFTWVLGHFLVHAIERTLT